jgi:mannose-1-phosphate guanylyltransferase
VQAVVLVGGFGTRLRPLTLSVPKQILPVGNVPMIERVVEHLGRSGVDEVVLSLGYQPDAFLDRYPDGTCAGVSMRYAVEPEPLDTAGAIAFAARAAGIDGRFIAVNGDVLTGLDVADLWNQHASRGAAATIALTPVDDPSRYGVVPLDADGRVEAFIEKPDPGTAPSNWINAGTYVLDASVLDAIEPGRRVSIEREVFPALVEQGAVYGVQSDAYWIDAGTPEAYLQVQLDLLAGRLGNVPDPIDPTATVDPSATVTGSFVGAGATVGPDVVVTDSVVMAGATIESGVRIERSLLGPGCVIGEASALSDLSVVGDGESVPAGTVVAAGRLPGPDTWPS